MSVTLKDVAQAARVSVSTASRALTGTGLTSERTQQRLVRIARELGYRPNPIARGLKTGQSRLVALLVHNLTNASFQVMAEVVQARLKALGYQMLLCIGGDDPQQESDTLTTLVDHRIDGLIVVPTGKNGAQLKTLAKDVPIVCLVRRDDATDLETVLADDPQGAYLGTRHLIELGHKRIGLIVGRQDTTSGRERLSGYVRALREAGIAKDDTLIHAGHFVPEIGATCTRKLLDLPRPPSAIFVANHEATLGVLRVTAERNIAIPQDLSLLCYEDMPWFEWHRPAISIVDNGARDLANLAVDRLLQRMDARGNGSDGVREYRVGARLIKRDSCRQIDVPAPVKSAKSKSSSSKSSAAKSAKV
ncbi:MULTISPECIES: LacI family DNA-binding transcriptional regulator [Bradyrhizobium]|uniref:LacI family DNA-binding transcriptional regulator n=1 Tax=Bradyrhizobium TaxID=374 RepID=UPI000416EDAD|nr:MULTISPECIES: LacI family DNA-binding transcriptional regulator [Bradyrhizobium]QOG22419.1 LacI family DNA-binding transcriptional regulator [Bradyrhizobium sp. SEMIA]UFW52934.1 LacI family transcriptional regulator [Bradyrhizobium arachidis]